MVLGCDWCHIFKQLVLLRVEPVRLIIYRAYSDTVKHLYGTHNVQLFSNARDKHSGRIKVWLQRQLSETDQLYPPAAQFATQQFYKVDESNTMTGDDRRRAAVPSIM